MILLHVFIAVLSIVVAGYTFFNPSRLKFKLNYALIALTLGSGTYLVVHEHSPMLQTCASGLAYLAIVCSGLLPARIKLAAKQD